MEQEKELIKQFNYTFLSASRWQMDFPVTMQIDDDTHNAIMTLLKDYEHLQKENEEMKLSLIEKAQEKYVEQNSVKEEDNFFNYYDKDNSEEILQTFLKDKMAVYNEDLDLCLEKVLNKLERLKQDNFEIKETYRRIARYIDQIGNSELAHYMLAQINDVPVWTVGDGRNYVSKQVIRDKWNEYRKNENCQYCNNTCNKYNLCNFVIEILGEE